MNSSEYTPTTLTMTGKSVDEIRNRLWQEYGNNYRIIDQQTVLQGGFLGFFQKKNCIKVSFVVKDRGHSEQEDFSTAKESIIKNSKVDYSKLVVKQYNELTGMMAQMNSQIEDLKITSVEKKHPSIVKIEKLLEDNEFTHAFINMISSKLKNESTLEDLNDFEQIQEKVVGWIGRSIKVAPEVYYKIPHIIVLVGPTGLGKTTTISKMAAKLILDAKKKGEPLPNVRLITIDHTRVGAEAQLRKFGELMHVRVDKAESPVDLNDIIQECKDSTDYIFIDTSGFSPNDYDNIAKMRNILNLQGFSLDTYLVVAASTKARDLKKTIENFSLFNFNSVIITKCDETTSYGNVLSVLYESNKTIAYITDGQKVPNDIKKASVREFLYRLSDFTVSKVYIDDMFPEDE
ncbi:hypothetical protein [Treponema sp.]|uniref:hypothetical protein n=1 Tax=Treponema sp. TaxID=166 RepID=UPI003FD8DC47